jgi:hypothetical protein
MATKRRFDTGKTSHGQGATRQIGALHDDKNNARMLGIETASDPDATSWRKNRHCALGLSRRRWIHGSGI